MRTTKQRPRHRAASAAARVEQFFADLGPGLITGAADDDPSGISTYSVTGASFGYAPLWIAPFSFPLMVSVQLTKRHRYCSQWRIVHHNRLCMTHGFPHACPQRLPLMKSDTTRRSQVSTQCRIESNIVPRPSTRGGAHADPDKQHVDCRARPAA
jgi:hypothetical protein